MYATCIDILSSRGTYRYVLYRASPSRLCSLSLSLPLPPLILLSYITWLLPLLSICTGTFACSRAIYLYCNISYLLLLYILQYIYLYVINDSKMYCLSLSPFFSVSLYIYMLIIIFHPFSHYTLLQCCCFNLLYGHHVQYTFILFELLEHSISCAVHRCLIHLLIHI